ncbi:putative membrane protein, partial [Agrobacterium pusense]
VLEDAKTMFEAFIKTGIAGSLRAYAENQRGTVRIYNVRVQGLTNP